MTWTKIFEINGKYMDSPFGDPIHFVPGRFVIYKDFDEMFFTIEKRDQINKEYYYSAIAEVYPKDVQKTTFKMNDVDVFQFEGKQTNQSVFEVTCLLFGNYFRIYVSDGIYRSRHILISKQGYQKFAKFFEEWKKE